MGSTPPPGLLNKDGPLGQLPLGDSSHGWVDTDILTQRRNLIPYKTPKQSF